MDEQPSDGVNLRKNIEDLIERVPNPVRVEVKPVVFEEIIPAGNTN